MSSPLTHALARRVRVLVAAVLAAGMAIQALVPPLTRAATVDVSAADQGLYLASGSHDPGQPSYAVGAFSSAELRNFFVFDLSGVAGGITGATLQIFNPPGGFNSPQASETWTLFDYTGSINALSSGTGGAAAYADLGAGTSFGSFTANSGNNNQLLNIPLNAAAVAAINGALGGQLAFGGAITTLDGNTSNLELLFAGSGAATPVLRLTTVPPDIAVTPTSGLTTTEAGGTATFSVVLASQPTANVVVSFASDDPSEGVASPGSLLFTPANWDTPQNVAVAGVDDTLDDGDIAYTIITAVAGGGYDGLVVPDVAVTNADDDTASIVVELAGNLETTETGGTATFSVRLTSTPSADVSFTLSSSDSTEGRLNAANLLTLTFTPANWSLRQQVVIAGQNDDVADGDIAYKIVTAPAVSGDGLYNGLDPADAPVTNRDDDSVGILLTPLAGATTEAGGEASFSIRLNSEPTAAVTIPLRSSNTAEGTVGPASVTFTPANWNAGQPVVVKGVDDAVDDGPIAYRLITDPAASADSGYNGLNGPDADLSNADDDGRGITVTQLDPAAGLPTEAGGTGRFSVVLDSQPTSNVVINLSSSDLSEGTVAPASLTFTPGNWNTPQTVTVTGVDDFLDDGEVGYEIVLAPAISNDALYDKLDPADVAAVTLDDDSSGFVVNPQSGLNVNEGGAAATFTVRLTSRPTDGVTIGISSSNTAECAVAPASLTFTDASWNVNQTVTVTGVNDDVDDGDRPCTIVTAPAVTADPTYKLLNPADVTATNADDDTAAIRVTPTTGLQTTEAGGTATFSVVLASKPLGPVSIGLSSDNTLAGTVSPASLTFTALSWNTPQTVTLRGVDDFVDDGNSVYKIVTAQAVSSDPLYAAIDPADVTATTLDDDAAGLAIVAAGNLVTSEAGDTAAFTVALASEPTDTVAVAVSSSDATEGTASPASLTFSAANWRTPQTVTVKGVADAEIDGPIAYSVLLDPSSSDPLYNGLPTARQPVTNLDDGAGLLLSPATGTTTEAGGAATFSLRLNREPTADVMIPLRSSDTTEGTVVPASVTFTPSNWNTPQSVSVVGVDDTLDDGDIAYQLISDPAASTDAAYNGLNGPDASLVNIDNDPLPALSIADATITEGDSGTTAMVFTVTLSAPSTQTVTVAYQAAAGTAESPADFESCAGQLSFAPGVTQRTLSCAVRGDLLSEETESFTVSLSGAVNASIADGQAVGTIVDNDGGPRIEIVCGDAREPASGSANAVCRLTLSAASARAVTVSYSTAGGTATAGSDYQARSGTVSFSPGATERTLTVPVLADRVSEPTETIVVRLSNPVNATIGIQDGIISILDLPSALQKQIYLPLIRLSTPQ